MHFDLQSKKTIYLFSSIALFFVLFDLASYFYLFTENQLYLRYYDKFLCITHERTVPTVFSFLISFLIGLTALLLYRERQKIGWLVVSIFFFYIGFDDVLSIHEYIGTIAADNLENSNYSSYYWQIIFVPIFATLGLYIFIFMILEFKKESCTTCMKLLFLGFSCYAIAVGMDYFEGLDHEFRYIMDRTDYFSMRDVLHILRATEEFIEMIGSTLILSTLLWLHPLKLSAE